MTEGNIQPLVSEQDPEIQQKVVTLVAKAGKRKKELYGTEEKICGAIAGLKENLLFYYRLYIFSFSTGF